MACVSRSGFSRGCASGRAGRGARSRRRDASPTSGRSSGSGTSRPGLLYAVNQEYADRDRELADGDEVALIPPVSGGAFLLTEEPLDPSAAIAEVPTDEAGAVATFIGTTRIHSRGRTVHYLEYEAYGGMAEQVMAEIADELKASTTSARSRSTTASAASTSASTRS